MKKGDFFPFLYGRQKAFSADEVKWSRVKSSKPVRQQQHRSRQSSCRPRRPSRTILIATERTTDKRNKCIEKVVAVEAVESEGRSEKDDDDNNDDDSFLRRKPCSSPKPR